MEQVQQVTPTIVESVAAELELEMQPFMLSSAALGNGGTQSPRSATEDNFMAAFNERLREGKIDEPNLRSTPESRI